MTLLENNEIISEDKSVAEIFNDYVANITNSFGIEETGKSTVSTLDIDDPVEIALTKCSLHPSSYSKIRLSTLFPRRSNDSNRRIRLKERISTGKYSS